MNTTEDFTATKIDSLKRVYEGLPINIDDLAKTQFQSHSERILTSPTIEIVGFLASD